jgi:osmotically-inducible protein OsmY
MNSNMVKGVLIAVLCAPVAGYAADAQLKAAAQAFGDSAILSGIKEAYAKDPQLSSANIRVSSTKGAVTLTGVATDQELADRAEALAHGVKGVVSVQNDLQVGAVGSTR